MPLPLTRQCESLPALMGGVAYYYSNQAIFFLTAAFGVPTLIALTRSGLRTSIPNWRAAGYEQTRGQRVVRCVSGPCDATGRC